MFELLNFGSWIVHVLEFYFRFSIFEIWICANVCVRLNCSKTNNIYRKTSLKADREIFSGGALKKPTKHRENERQRDHSHRGSRGTKGTNEIP